MPFTFSWNSLICFRFFHHWAKIIKKQDPVKHLRGAICNIAIPNFYAPVSKVRYVMHINPYSVELEMLVHLKQALQHHSKISRNGERVCFIQWEWEASVRDEKCMKKVWKSMKLYERHGFKKSKYFLLWVKCFLKLEN